MPTKHFVFQDEISGGGTEVTRHYEKGDQDTLKTFTEALIQEEVAPEKNEVGAYVNPLIAVSETPDEEE